MMITNLFTTTLCFDRLESCCFVNNLFDSTDFNSGHFADIFGAKMYVITKCFGFKA